MPVGLNMKCDRVAVMYLDGLVDQANAKKTCSRRRFSLSYGEYAAKVGVWRILDMLDRYGIKATFDVGGLAAERHPNIRRAMHDRGHEAAGHGWANDVHVSDDDFEGELKAIRDTAAAIEAGYGERPVGWVSPGSVGSARTMEYMVSEGFLWNGDDAPDDMPFLRKVGDKPLIILPRVNFPTNDLIVWQNPQNAPSVYYEGFKETFDFLYEEGKQDYTRVPALLGAARFLALVADHEGDHGDQSMVAPGRSRSRQAAWGGCPHSDRFSPTTERAHRLTECRNSAV